MRKSKEKIVFLDVDGTLVNAQGEICESARYAVKKAQENGHRMVVCSGRSRFQLPEELLKLGFRGMIASAGAHIMSDGREIYHVQIDEAHRRQAAEYMQEHDIIYYFQADNGIVITERDRDRMLEFGEKLGMDTDYTRQFLGSVYIQEQVWRNERAEKVIYFDSPFSVEQMNQDLQPYYEVVSMSMPGTDETCGEIGISGINKATAMERYLYYVKAAREDCVAVGDGPNDLQMMDYAGISVAMGNALESVKKKADLVTADINEDGILKAFRTLGLI